MSKELVLNTDEEVKGRNRKSYAVGGKCLLYLRHAGSTATTRKVSVKRIESEGGIVRLMQPAVPVGPGLLFGQRPCRVVPSAIANLGAFRREVCPTQPLPSCN